MYVLFWLIVKLHSMKGNENKPKKVSKIKKNNIKSIWKHVCPTYAIPGLRFCLRFWRGVLRFSLRFPMKCEQFSGLTSWFFHRGNFSKIIYIYMATCGNPFLNEWPLEGLRPGVCATQWFQCFLGFIFVLQYFHHMSMLFFVCVLVLFFGSAPGSAPYI